MPRKTIERCQECGESLRRGRTHSGGRQYTCLICQVAYALDSWRYYIKPRRPSGICSCCGRAGHVRGWGLIDGCYERRRKLPGALAEWKRFYCERG